MEARHALPVRAWRTLVAACAVLGAAFFVGLGGTASAAEVGTVPDLTWGISHADVDRTVGLLEQAGVRSVRTNVNWLLVEPTGKGVQDPAVLADVDYAVRAARAAGIEVLMPVADGVPYWASGDPSRHSDASGNHWNTTYKPSNMGDYAEFLRSVVRRYAPQGVHAYEIWNEPNLDWAWPSGPNASDYAAMLAAGYPAVKQEDPGSTVVLGGLAANDYGFLQALYDAGAGSNFDVVGVHPYPWPAAGQSLDPTSCWNDGPGRTAAAAFCGIESVRQTMIANGDSGKDIWATEFGWASYTGTWGVSEEQQADYLTKAFTKLEDYPYVKKAFWYNFRNYPDDANSWGSQLGLVRRDFSTKPAYAALRSYTTPGAVSPSADSSVAPASGTSAAPAPATLSAPAGVARPDPRSTQTRPTQARISSARYVRSRDKRGRIVVRGRVSGTGAGSVAIILERQLRGGWRVGRTLTGTLDQRGQLLIRARGPLVRGRWRATAVFQGTPGLTPSRSRAVRVTT